MRLRSGGPDLPRAVYWIALAAFALRLGTRICAGSANFFESGYSFFFGMAQSIAAGRGIALEASTAFRVPLYPIFLAALTLGHKVLWPVAIAQSIVGAGTCVGAALLARRMFDGQFGGHAGAKASILAACITAIYPYYLVHDTALQETSLFTLLTLCAVLSLQRAERTGIFFSATLSGVLLGLDVLTRATIAPFAVFAGLWLFRRRAAEGLWCILFLAITVSPWLWRSYKLTGSPALSTETGIELWAGNNGLLFRHYPAESSDLSKAEALASLSAEDRHELSVLSGNEALINHWFLERGFLYMRSHPWATVRDDTRKVVAVFGWLPVARRGRMPDLIHVLSYGPVMLLGIWGMWQRRSLWRDDSLIYGLFATFVLVTAVFFGDTSHRSYLDVYWIVFGAGALVSFSRSASEVSIGERRVESFA